MEASSTIPWLLCISLATFVFYKVCLSGQKRSRSSSTDWPLPPGPTPLPLLGNIFQLQGELHHALAKLAAVHGPVISLKLGSTTAVVASSAACARDVLQRHDEILSARSITDAARALGNHERSFIWLPSTSPLWRRLRGLSTTHLFSSHGLDAKRAVRETKVRELVGCFRGHAGEAVHVGRVLRPGMLNLVSNVLLSEDVADLSSDVGRVQELEMMISDILEELTKPNLSDLFSSHGLDAKRAVRETKVRELVGCFRGHAGEAVHVGRVLRPGMLNLVSNVLLSEDVADLSSDVGRVQELEMMISDILEELTKPNLSDLFPALASLDLQGRRRRTAERLTRFFDFFDPIIDRRLKAGGESKEDFLDVLLKLHSVEQLSVQTIKSFLLDLFVAGTDTNSLTVEWTMAELLRQPAIMSKVRAELQQVLGSKQHPDESDISNLPYLRTVVMETMRFHPPSPLLMPREAMAEGAEVGGFAVPKGAMVIVNLWAIMRDPATWTQPEKFVPERFLAVDMDFRGLDRFEFMPFGAGRRACPGMPMATRVVMLILASLLHAFEWRLPEGMQPCDVDVRDRFGTSLNMVTPLKAVPLPLC